MSRNCTRTTIGALPDEMLTNIFARVAADDASALIRVQCCCRRFQEAGSQNEAYRRADLSRFHYPLRKDEKKFIRKCSSADNLEAIFRVGMMKYFNRTDRQRGSMVELRRAKDLGHLGAKFAIGMILISHGLPSSKDGCDLLNELFDSIGADIERYAEIRFQVMAFLHGTRRGYRFTRENWNVRCENPNHDQLLQEQLPTLQIVNACRSCRWYREFRFWMTIIH